MIINFCVFDLLMKHKVGNNVKQLLDYDTSSFAFIKFQFLMKLFYPNNFRREYANAQYSTSALDWTTAFRFLLFQKMIFPPMKTLSSSEASIYERSYLINIRIPKDLDIFFIFI